MTDERSSEVLGGLPRTRPHRRSAKRDGARKPRDPATADPGAPTAPAPAPVAMARAATREPTTTREPKATATREPKATATRKPKATTARRQPPAPTQPPQRPRREPLAQPAQPAGGPPPPARRGPVPLSGAEVLGTAVHAAAELTEMGLNATTRVIRGALSRLPRP